jgi:hypothetical protein
MNRQLATGNRQPVPPISAPNLEKILKKGTISHFIFLLSFCISISCKSGKSIALVNLQKTLILPLYPIMKTVIPGTQPL